MKRGVPLFITFSVGLLLILTVFIPPTEHWGETFSLFFDIIAVFAFFLGGGNLVRSHFSKLSGKKEERLYSLVTLVAFFFMLAAGLFKIANSGGIGAPVTANGSLFQESFSYVMNPLGATMYALLAFFIASASYRAFRAKNREATILLIAAFIILLGRTPLGVLVTGWIPDSWDIFQIPNMAIWIMNSPNLAGQRAILIGIGLGVASMSLRVILGIERTYLGEDKS
jgi:hypothetical protein